MQQLILELRKHAGLTADNILWTTADQQARDKSTAPGRSCPRDHGLSFDSHWRKTRREQQNWNRTHSLQCCTMTHKINKLNQIVACKTNNLNSFRPYLQAKAMELPSLQILTNPHQDYPVANSSPPDPISIPPYLAFWDTTDHPWCACFPIQKRTITFLFFYSRYVSGGLWSVGLSKRHNVSWLHAESW